ncbi:response regulator [Azohydromonas lata]|uniref:Response regulator n=1 Tax=Azohydromonas lata TaxID=45677 RepID=A0ABU5I820_9BURK|nr:response regulator [Azohydromonas lata]MDZ5455247.1 response regulator [Azohydromonas lata]
MNAISDCRHGGIAETDALRDTKARAMPPVHESVVLYVEDDPVNALLMQHLLAAHRPRCALHVAEDGRSGVACAERLRPDLVLIDMNLPDISGLEVLQALRQNPRTQSLRCIALSANAMPDIVEHARTAGFNDYWTKPIDIHEFLQDLDGQLARH